MRSSQGPRCCWATVSGAFEALQRRSPPPEGRHSRSRLRGGPVCREPPCTPPALTWEAETESVAQEAAASEIQGSGEDQVRSSTSPSCWLVRQQVGESGGVGGVEQGREVQNDRACRRRSPLIIADRAGHAARCARRMRQLPGPAVEPGLHARAASTLQARPPSVLLAPHRNRRPTRPQSLPGRKNAFTSSAGCCSGCASNQWGVFELAWAG